MKKVTLIISAGIIASSMFYACQKEEAQLEFSSLKETKNESNSKRRVNKISLNTYWEKEIVKNDFIKILEDAGETNIEVISNKLPETVSIIMTIRNNQLEQYLSFTDGYYLTSKVSARPVSSNAQEKVFNLRMGAIVDYMLTEQINTGELKIENRFVDVVLKTARDIQIGMDDNMPPAGAFCCNLCAGVHSALGISSLDCICCALSCDFSCSFDPMIVIN